MKESYPNTVGKEENVCYEQFLLFPQCFQKACFQGASKGVIMWEWVKCCFGLDMLQNSQFCRSETRLQVLFNMILTCTIQKSHVENSTKEVYMAFLLLLYSHVEVKALPNNKTLDCRLNAFADLII